MTSLLPRWPPELPESQLESLTLLATTFALSHGLLYLPVSLSPPPAPTSAIHAPITLFPTPFSRRLFFQAQRLQRVYNVLYARVAMDEVFLDRVMGDLEGVGKVDEFVGQLWRGWKQVRDQDNVQVRSSVTGLNVTLNAIVPCIQDVAVGAIPIGLSDA